MRFEATYLNRHIELFDGVFGEERRAELMALPRLAQSPPRTGYPVLPFTAWSVVWLCSAPLPPSSLPLRAERELPAARPRREMDVLPPVTTGRRRARAYDPSATAADRTIVTRATRGQRHIALVAATRCASVTRYSSSGCSRIRAIKPVYNDHDHDQNWNDNRGNQPRTHFVHLFDADRKARLRGAMRQISRRGSASHGQWCQAGLTPGASAGECASVQRSPNLHLTAPC
jgi:hypothetical protein